MASRENYPAVAEARLRARCSAPNFQLGAMYRTVTDQSLQFTAARTIPAPKQAPNPRNITAAVASTCATAAADASQAVNGGAIWQYQCSHAGVYGQWSASREPA
jgi:hypothetical protein